MLFILHPQNFPRTKLDMHPAYMTLQFPGGFFWTKVLPLHLHLTNGVIPKQHLPPFEDTIRFHQKISSGLHLDIIPVT